MAERARSLQQLASEFAGITDADAATAKIRTLNNTEYLRVVQNPDLQRHLRILDPVGHALYSFQVLLAVATGLMALFCSGSIIFALRVLGEKAPPLLSNAYRASYVAIVAFALFAVAYRQYRSELETFVGREYTVVPDYFVALAVVLVLAVLTAVSAKGELDIKQFVSVRLLLLLSVGAALGIEWQRPHLLRKFIGINTTIYIQSVWALIAIVAVFFVVLVLWPRRGLS